MWPLFDFCMKQIQIRKSTDCVNNLTFIKNSSVGIFFRNLCVFNRLRQDHLMSELIINLFNPDSKASKVSLLEF